MDVCRSVIQLKGRYQYPKRTKEAYTQYHRTHHVELEYLASQFRSLDDAKALFASSHSTPSIISRPELPELIEISGPGSRSINQGPSNQLPPVPSSLLRSGNSAYTDPWSYLAASSATSLSGLPAPSESFENIGLPPHHFTTNEANYAWSQQDEEDDFDDDQIEEVL